MTASPSSVNRLSRENVEASMSHNPMGLHGLLQGLLYVYLFATVTAMRIPHMPLVFWKGRYHDYQTAETNGVAQAAAISPLQRHTFLQELRSIGLWNKRFGGFVSWRNYAPETALSRSTISLDVALCGPVKFNNVSGESNTSIFGVRE
jgi:hypothetical protein